LPSLCCHLPPTIQKELYTSRSLLWILLIVTYHSAMEHRFPQLHSTHNTLCCKFCHPWVLKKWVHHMSCKNLWRKGLGLSFPISSTQVLCWASETQTWFNPPTPSLVWCHLFHRCHKPPPQWGINSYPRNEVTYSPQALIIQAQHRNHWKYKCRKHSSAVSLTLQHWVFTQCLICCV
jgi:hypothetical protein